VKKDCPDICMLVRNSVTRDPRVRKEAESLAAHGYSVQVLGIKLRPNEPDEEVFPPGYTVVRTGSFRIKCLINKLLFCLSSGQPGKVKRIAGACVKNIFKLYLLGSIF